MHEMCTCLMAVLPVHVLRHAPLVFLPRRAVQEGALKALHSAIELLTFGSWPFWICSAMLRSQGCCAGVGCNDIQVRAVKH
jgi:hypothetical protein